MNQATRKIIKEVIKEKRGKTYLQVAEIITGFWTIGTLFALVYIFLWLVY